MVQGRKLKNSREQLARIVSGPDAEATHMVIDGQDSKELLARENAVRFNQSIDELQEKFKAHVDELNELGKRISDDLENLEIMPLTSYVLISPFKHNPFQKVEVKSGIITDLGGMVPTYKSQETGEIEEEKEYIRTGIVTETGTECKFLKPGDIVFYNIASEVQVPFYKFGFVIVAEQRIIAVVNEKLTDRKKDIMDGNETD